MRGGARRAPRAPEMQRQLCVAAHRRLGWRKKMRSRVGTTWLTLKMAFLKSLGSAGRALEGGGSILQGLVVQVVVNQKKRTQKVVPGVRRHRGGGAEPNSVPNVQEVQR